LSHSKRAEPGRDLRFERGPGAFERLEILFAQRVEMEAANAFEMFRLKLIDRETEA